MSAKTWWTVQLGMIVLRAIGATWRIRRVNDAPWRARRARGESVLFSLWHHDLLALSWAHRGGGEVVIVSEHRDGELIARVLDRLGAKSVRGSTTRGGTRALLALIRMLEEGHPGAVTPDGPRGPVHAFQPGVLAAARRANVPIVPIGVAVNRAWRLRSWDRFIVPKPFATIAIVYMDPTMVGPTSASLDDEVPRFGALMHDAATRAAESLAGA